MFSCPAKPSKRGGRNMGGIIVYISCKIIDNVSRVCADFDTGVIFRCDKRLFGLEIDVILACLYFSPENSVSNDGTKAKGIKSFENLIMENVDIFGNKEILLCGDLNSRIGSMSDIDVIDNDIPVLHFVDEITEEISSVRHTEDKIVNKFGRDLIEFCKVHSVFIANGRFGVKSGDFTYLSSMGCSVIDYFLCTKSVFDVIVDFNIDCRSESDHLPIHIEVKIVPLYTTFENHSSDGNVGPVNSKIIIDESNCEVFQSLLYDKVQSGKMYELDKQIEDANFNVDAILQTFESIILDCSSQFKTKHINSKHKRKSQWFDRECKVLKSKMNNLLRKFRQSKHLNDLNSYLDCKQKYNSLCKNKKKDYNTCMRNKLDSLMGKPKLFWRALKNINGKSNQHDKPKISSNQWFKHFKSLFSDNDSETDADIDTSDDYDLTDIEECLFNNEITDDEIIEAVKNINTGKASSGNLIAEHFKYGIHILLPYIRKLFNRLYSSGEFPTCWSTSIVIPIHKKGNPNDTNNYRGIALLDVFSKIYISILTTRVTFYTNAYSKLSEAQAGFRSDYSTIDNGFVLYSIINKYLCKKGKKLYVAFIDFKKAFDSVNRNKLYKALLKHGIKGKLFSSIKSIYQLVKSRVKSNNNILTECFECPIGLRQGCKLSPILFCLFINELESYMRSTVSHGIQLLPNDVELFLLMFADDVGLFSDTIVGLQKQLDELHKYCLEWKLSVNVEKTKIVVFKNGGILAKREKWFYDSQPIEIVNAFAYVGLNFTARMSLSKMSEHMAIKAKHVFISLLKNLYHLLPMSRQMFFKIFDTKISPILLYGSEIWGLEFMNSIEQVHTYACKRFMNVSLKACNLAVMGDCARYPMFILASKRCVKYWIKILNMNNDRYVKKCYFLLKNMDENGHKNWVTTLRLNLFKNGFGYIWEQQMIENPTLFLNEYVNRLKDQYIQEWSDKCNSNGKMEFYCHYKTFFTYEKYLDCVDLMKFRRSISAFRTSSHHLMIEKGRHFGIEREFRYCIHCTDRVENEFHFIVECPLYDQLREKYIPNSFIQQPYLEKFYSLMSCSNETIIRNLAMFIHHAFILRKNIMD